MPLPLLPDLELNLTDLSRDGMLERLQSLYFQANPSWSDFHIGHPENLLLEGQALLISAAVSHSRELVRQLSWSTLTDRLAAIRKGRQDGFSLTGGAAALLTGNFYLPGAALATKRIILPVGLRVRSGSVLYTINVDTEIAIGDNGNSGVSLENSTTQTEVIQSPNQANFRHKLVHTPYIEGSLEVTATDGEYTNVNASGDRYRSFLDMTPDTKGYIALMDNYGYLYVYFGNSIYGAVPQGAITFTYKTGGGVEGAVDAGATWQVVDSVYDEDGDEVQVLFSNASASSTGVDPMSVEEAKVRGPIAAQVQEATVNEQQAEWVCTSVAGISHALCATSERVPTMAEDVALIHLVAQGTQYSSGYFAPAAPTASQIAEAETMLDEEQGEYGFLMGVRLSLQAAAFHDITVAARLYKATGYTAAQVKANVTAALQNYFAVTNSNNVPNSILNFGAMLKDASGTVDQTLPWSWIFNVINDTAGVRKLSPATDNLLLNGAHSDIVVPYIKWPRLSTITLYDEDNSGVIM